MEIFEEIFFAFRENVFLTVTLGIGGVGLLVAALVGYLFKDAGVYTALFITVLGLVAVAVVWGKGDLKMGITCLALLAVFGGVAYLLVFTALTVRKNILTRRQHRAEATRRLSYTLPDRDNTYVRSRLQTSLDVANEEEGERRKFKLSHARRLLARIKEEPLSVAERLEAEEMTRLLALYIQKERWSAEDTRTVNELFSRILKLSGKYAV